MRYRPIYSPFMAVLAVAFFHFNVCSQVCSGSGCLDADFGGGNGKILDSVNFSTGGGWAVDAVLQPDGKIVVAAVGDNYPANGGRDTYVLRYDSTGLRDQSFGVGGIVRFGFTSAIDNENVQAIELQADGKIIVGGYTPTGAAIARLTDVGQLDSSFGSGGKVVFKYSGKEESSIFDIIVQPDQRIVVGGRSATKFAFARFTALGAFDTSFNGTGKFRLQVSSGSTAASINAVALQPDGKIVGAGARPGSGKNSSELDFAVIRLNAGGTLDNSFGTSGQVYLDFGDGAFGDTIWDVARDVKLDPSGGILVVGDSLLRIPSETKLSLARLTANGQLVTTFGSGGKTMQGAIGTWYRVEGKVALLADGRIVGAGVIRLPPALNSDLGLFRLNPNGSFDTSFGNGGVVTTDSGGRSDIGESLLIQQDGKYVVAGFANGGNNIIVARYIP